ncbi:MAG: hypothetical protein ACE5OZ_23310 [Candidatus Heimdallarchaeota archaeon]
MTVWNMEKLLPILESLTVPYHIQKLLERRTLRYMQKSDVMEKYERTIDHFVGLEPIKKTHTIKKLEKKGTLGELVKPRDLSEITDEEGKKLSIQAAVYFQQGFQMLKTSQEMNENSSPTSGVLWFSAMCQRFDHLRVRPDG